MTFPDRPITDAEFQFAVDRLNVEIRRALCEALAYVFHPAAPGEALSPIQTLRDVERRVGRPAGTIAAVLSGTRKPTIDLLSDLFLACGVVLRVEVVPIEPVDLMHQRPEPDEPRDLEREAAELLAGITFIDPPPVEPENPATPEPVTAEETAAEIGDWPLPEDAGDIS